MEKQRVWGGRKYSTLRIQFFLATAELFLSLPKSFCPCQSLSVLVEVCQIIQKKFIIKKYLQLIYTGKRNSGDIVAIVTTKPERTGSQFFFISGGKLWSISL